MRPVEILVIGRDTNTAPLEFRSIRTAHQYIEDSLYPTESDLCVIHSRVHINNRLTEEWMLAAADASRVKFYLIRLKPTPISS